MHLTYSCIFYYFVLVHFLDLKWPNCLELPFAKTSPNYYFVTPDPLKLTFDCDLAHLLDVGVKIDNKWGTLLTRADFRLKMSNLSSFFVKKMQKTEERYEGLRDVQSPLEGFWWWPATPQSFGIGWTTSQPWGGGVQPPLKAFRRGRPPPIAF